MNTDKQKGNTVCTSARLILCAFRLARVKLAQVFSFGNGQCIYCSVSETVTRQHRPRRTEMAKKLIEKTPRAVHDDSCIQSPGFLHSCCAAHSVPLQISPLSSAANDKLFHGPR
eukprot:1116069-Pleurochrysis_carterae.AAC.3